MPPAEYQKARNLQPSWGPSVQTGFSQTKNDESFIVAKILWFRAFLIFFI
jgi:hypothetical protein